jgi:hypothetical protein
VQSDVYITASEPSGDVTVGYLTHHGNAGITPLGYRPGRILTHTWRIRGTHLLRSVEDVINGYEDSLWPASRHSVSVGCDTQNRPIWRAMIKADRALTDRTCR